MKIPQLVNTASSPMMLHYPSLSPSFMSLQALQIQSTHSHPPPIPFCLPLPQLAHPRSVARRRRDVLPSPCLWVLAPSPQPPSASPSLCTVQFPLIPRSSRPPTPTAVSASTSLHLPPLCEPPQISRPPPPRDLFPRTRSSRRREVVTAAPLPVDNGKEDGDPWVVR
ncbi:uncharacterized protein BDZ99DRAFT_482588 [Mytilinidion resinicola]|uniref:Uncharacterized protein n=1 Tax=Mytilinidion resinicola TaxID=574789 RepID=A0A6A6Y2D5_9PEZI|nr:uncharacterized protein BDZ99DRAFT_482588 [Mytilinidion resinicola]KAF2802718.1 hypothetical protein BDZ99DRAFT_482588 [Mytilinidion resinicola]